MKNKEIRNKQIFFIENPSTIEYHEDTL